MTQENGTASCGACKDGVEAPFPFSMAFQPIVNVESGSIYAYEALVRSTGSESADSALRQITLENRHAFDQSCRVKAISLAAALGLANTHAKLSINFLPGAVYSPAACIQLTLKTARECGLPAHQLIFEVVEHEEVLDLAHLRGIVSDYRQRGLRVALDDFGAGHSGLNMLADFPTDIIKLDMALTRRLHQRTAALAIVKSMALLARTLGSDLIAEGVETLDEYAALRDCGITLMQGYLFARPGLETLPEFKMPQMDNSS